MTSLQHVYEVRPRKDHRGVDLISDALPFGRLLIEVSNAIGYAKHSQPVTSRCDACILSQNSSASNPAPQMSKATPVA